MDGWIHGWMDGWMDSVVVDIRTVAVFQRIATYARTVGGVNLFGPGYMNNTHTGVCLPNSTGCCRWRRAGGTPAAAAVAGDVRVLFICASCVVRGAWCVVRGCGAPLVYGRAR